MQAQRSDAHYTIQRMWAQLEIWAKLVYNGQNHMSKWKPGKRRNHKVPDVRNKLNAYVHYRQRTYLWGSDPGSAGWLL
jgi:hypothetical protein